MPTHKKTSQTGYKVTKPRLACPFHARHPHSCTRRTSCHGVGFETPARVVEHLKRTHSCADPGSPYGDNTTLSDEEHEHITAEQLTRISSIDPKKYSPLEKWKKIYLVLFPHDGDSDIPSPHANPVQQMYDYTSSHSDWMLNLLSERLGLSREDIVTALNLLRKLLPAVSDVARQRRRMQSRSENQPHGNAFHSGATGNSHLGLSYKDTSTGIQTPDSSGTDCGMDVDLNLSPTLVKFANEGTVIATQSSDMVDADINILSLAMEDLDNLYYSDDWEKQFVDWDYENTSDYHDADLDLDQH